MRRDAWWERSVAMTQSMMSARAFLRSVLVNVENGSVSLFWMIRYPDAHECASRTLVLLYLMASSCSVVAKKALLTPWWS